jgi:hypothetical protein
MYMIICLLSRIQEKILGERYGSSKKELPET